MKRTFLKLTGFLVVTTLLSSCGVEIRSGSDSTEFIFKHQDTVQYQIQRIDRHGFAQQELSSGCLYLTAGEMRSVIIEDEDILTEFEFTYHVRGDHLIVTIKEDNSLLHRSYHRSNLFSDGYKVDQKVATGFGFSYRMILEDSKCL